MNDPFFADYMNRLEGLQSKLHGELRDLPLEAMDWTPGVKMSSPAVLMAHMTAVLREGIELAEGSPSSRVREQEFQTRGLGAEEMLRRFDPVMDFARIVLPGLTWDDMRQTRMDDDGPITVSRALLHALEHAYLHLGHLQITCQLWRQREAS
jgi:hypothetical protein